MRVLFTFKNFLFTALMLASLGSVGQSVIGKLENMKARAIGPAGMSGRVTAIDVVLSDPDIIYAGTASGGLWKSTSGGIDWEPVFDGEKVASIGAVAIQQSNPDVIWAGTGEGNPRNSVTGGYGLYRSLDAGKTWQLVGLEKTRNIHRILIDPSNPDVVYVGAIGSSWGEHPERGVFRTRDGGKTWEKVLFTNEKSGVADMIMDPSNPKKIFVAMWEHQRKPWTFHSGGPGSGLYLTIDGGDNWKKLNGEGGLPKGDYGRIGLAIARNKPNVVYALVESSKNALYRSDDGGYKWTKTSDKDDIGNRPFYYSEIYVDPTNENRVYSLFSLVNVSEDGGRSFRTLLPYSGIHPDHHAWWIHPSDGNYMIDGNDGGLNITRDGGKTWRFAGNIPVAQYYHINVDNDFPYNVYGGMQDNGSWVGPAYVLRNDGIRNSYFQEVMFGDGFDVVPDPQDSRYGYAMSQGGNVGRYDRETGRTSTVRPTHPDKDVKLRFNWNAAIAQDPFDASTIYYGSQFLHVSRDKGKTWEVISGDLTSNDPEKQKQEESGGLTIDATGAENFCTIVSIEPSPAKKGVIWVGTDDGKLHLTTDGGKNWTEVTSRMTGMPKGAWIPQIRASHDNPSEVFVIVNNYRQFDFKPYLFHSSDNGTNWRNLVSEDKVWGYTHAFVQDKVEKNLMFLGTEFGLYVSLDRGVTWEKWTHGYPTVSTIDLVIHPREHDLVIGTFGRAAYVLDDIRPLRELAASNGVSGKKFHVFTPPVAVLAEYQQPEGPRFAGDSEWEGENRRPGAMISYWFNSEQASPKAAPAPASAKAKKGKTPAVEPVKEEKKTTKADSVVFEIVNSEGEVIRTLKYKSPEKDGLYRIYWFLDEKGVSRPSRRSQGFGGGGFRFEPRGVTVLPGIYTVKASYGEVVSETKIEVIADPRTGETAAEMKAKYDMLKEIEGYVDVLGQATKRINESLEIVADYEKKLREKKGEEYKSVKELTKATKDSLNGYLDAILGKVIEKQGLTRSSDPTVYGYFMTASRYISSVYGVPGATEERLLAFAKDEFDLIIKEINDFYAKSWPNFKETIQKTDLSPFGEYEPLKK